MTLKWDPVPCVVLYQCYHHLRIEWNDDFYPRLLLFWKLLLLQLRHYTDNRQRIFLLSNYNLPIWNILGSFWDQFQLNFRLVLRSFLGHIRFILYLLYIHFWFRSILDLFYFHFMSILGRFSPLEIATFAI